MLAPEDCLMGFAMVLESPHGIPEFWARGAHHAALAGGGHDLVLAEAPSRHIAETANRPAVDAGAMGLEHVFDHGDAVGTGQITNSWHVGWPAAQVHHGNGLGARGDQWCDCGGCDGAGIEIDIGKNRLSTKQQCTGCSGDRRCAAL